MSKSSLPPAESPAGVEYHLVMQGGRPGVWRRVVGVVLLGISTFVLAGIFWQVVFAVYFALAGQDVVDGLSSLVDLANVTPIGLAYVNLTLASAIPLSFAVYRLMHGLRPGWLTSIAPRMRWGYFAVCLGLSVVALFASLTVSAMQPQPEMGMGIDGSVNPWTNTVRDFVLVIAFLTPLQAAAEEYVFRGYLTQAFGSLSSRFGQAASRAVAVVVPAFIFACAHGLGQEIPIFFDRFAFGVTAGVLVIVTGGLEAPIAMHVLNNFAAFGIALAFGDMTSALNPSGATWWMIPGTLAQSLTYLALAWWVARKMGLANTGTPVVLAGRKAPVYRDPSARSPR